MTAKRFIPIFDGFDKRVVGATDNGMIISFMGMFDLLNEQHETIQQVKKVLQEEYSERVKELDHWAEKEDWNSYGATKLEYGTVLRLAKKLGIELE